MIIILNGQSISIFFLNYLLVESHKIKCYNYDEILDEAEKYSRYFIKYEIFSFLVPIRLVWATEGDNVDLPCDITPPTPEDSVNMVLWFKDNAGIPLYRQVLHFKNNPTPIRLFLRGTNATKMGRQLIWI